MSKLPQKTCRRTLLGASQKSNIVDFGSTCYCENCKVRAHICSCGQIFTFPQLRRTYTRMGAKDEAGMDAYTMLFGIPRIEDTGLEFDRYNRPMCPRCQRIYTEQEILRLS